MNTSPPRAPQSSSTQPHFQRSIGLISATSINMTQMCGIGPFLTIPLIVTAMGGTQALIGWVIGAIIAMADGLIWAELGAAMPSAGGTYLYLREAFQYTSGRLMPFLFVWTAMIGLPLMMATGVIGLVQYLGYYSPPAQVATMPAPDAATASDVPSTTPAASWHDWIPAAPQIALTFPQACIAIGVVAVVVFGLYRKVGAVGKLTTILWGIMLLSIASVIIAAFCDFHPANLQLPPHALDLNPKFFAGLGAGLVFALYDYAGYSTTAYMAGELRDPGRTLPRSIIFSILGIMALYLLLQVGVLGALPIEQVKNSQWIASDVLEHAWGRHIAMIFTALIIITAFASVFTGLLGASRIPFHAAKDKLFLPIFGRLHPRLNIPHISLLVMGLFTAIGSLFTLGDVIDMLTAVMVLIQSISQIAALTTLRKRQPTLQRPYRVNFYPLPNIIALLGWSYLYWSCSAKAIVLSLVWLLLGIIAFLLWAKAESTWPFGPKEIREEFLDAERHGLDPATAQL
jgi:amino acid transporter